MASRHEHEIDMSRLTSDEIKRRLVAAHRDAPDGDKMVAVILFGIEYASEIADCGVSCAELVRALHVKLGPTLSAGVKLARHVELRK